MLKLTCSDGFTADYSVKDENDITYITISAKSDYPAKLSLALTWEEYVMGAVSRWAPMFFKDKSIPADWDERWPESNAMCCAPILTLVGYNDENCITIASSDAKNKNRFKLSVVEETGLISCGVFVDVGCDLCEYNSIIRIDRRRIPFYDVIQDISRWWETFPGYTPCPVPEIAKKPFYSTWYSYHQNIDTEKLLCECRYFKNLGCEGIIIDDGWQTSDANRGYASCGDWEVCPEKIADIKKFSDAVHSEGMKFLLWFSVPFAGCDSKAYPKFKGKTLNDHPINGAYILDPRYPEVREHIIGIYKNAAENWGLDGFKLDFIDCFWQTDNTSEGMDYVSVYDAVDRLMKDVMYTLRKVNPDIMVEFRQSYIGPLMRTFGNMFRSGDCPADSLTNRLNILSLRQTSGNTAVHADMIMWNENDPAHIAAYQLTNVLFSVPQISVSCKVITEEQKKMLSYYLSFWNKYSNVILDGRMEYHNYAANYSYVASILENKVVGALYGDYVPEIKLEMSEYVLVNARPNEKLIADFEGGKYNITVCDCMGSVVLSEEKEYSSICRFDVPVNGYVYIKKSFS